MLVTLHFVSFPPNILRSNLEHKCRNSQGKHRTERPYRERYVQFLRVTLGHPVLILLYSLSDGVLRRSAERLFLIRSWLLFVFCLFPRIMTSSLWIPFAFRNSLWSVEEPRREVEVGTKRRKENACGTGFIHHARCTVRFATLGNRGNMGDDA